MSLVYCHEHDTHYDMDTGEVCPLCSEQPPLKKKRVPQPGDLLHFSCPKCGQALASTLTADWIASGTICGTRCDHCSHVFDQNVNDGIATEAN